MLLFEKAVKTGQYEVSHMNILGQSKIVSATVLHKMQRVP